LVIGGPFNVNHPITIATNPTTGTYKLGGSTDNNSSFSNLVTLNQPLTISQAANAGTNALTFKGGITSGVGATNKVTFVGPGNVVVTTTGISDGGGQLSVVVSGGSLILNASNSYSGGTTVANGGTLGGSGTVSSFVTNYAGGNLVPGKNVGTAGTVLSISNLTLLAGSTSTFAVLHGNINDKVVAQSVSYGGTLTLTSANAAALAAGDTFQLFSASTNSGSFAATNLPALSAGLGWNTSSLTNGTIAVVTTGVSTPPNFSNVRFSGGSLILSGANGTPSAQYRILTSTNVALPLASWTPVVTNVFASDGSYSYTNSAATNSAGFFILVSP